MKKNAEESREEIDERIINEEYKIWKKNTPFMYDLIITHPLEWPSLTVEWLPGREEPPGKDYALQKMILGTQTNDDNQSNYLLTAQVQLRREESEYDVKHYGDVQSDAGEFGSAGKVEVVQRIVHDGEVNRARYMPQSQSIIATQTVNGEVYIFDTRKHPPIPPPNSACNPDLRLQGHKLEGCGLSWNKLKPGLLVSGADDSLICMWDISGTSTNKTLYAMNIYKVHEGVVEDVAWHSKYEYLFGSVGDDRYMHLWDLRSKSPNKPAQSTTAHDAAVTCLAFNPINEWTVATGSADNTVKLFDIRKFESALCIFDCHQDLILQVGWSPTNESVLASSCLGRRLMVWDLSRINEQQTLEEAIDGPPELLFIHGGHSSKISDFSWNPSEDWVIASVAGDNILQIWQMAGNIYHNEDDLVRGHNAGT